jgi:hypothetical protein
MPSLLSGFITIVGGVHIILVSEPGSHLIHFLDLFMSFGCCSFLPFNIVSHLIQVDEFWLFFIFF